DQFNAVQHDREIVVGNDQRLSVARDDTVIVERDRHTTIKGGWHLDVKAHREELSQANYHSETAGDYSRLTEGKETILTGKENTIQAKKIILKGNEKVDIQGPMGRIIIDESGITLDGPIIRLRGKVEILPPVVSSLSASKGGGGSFNHDEIHASTFSPVENDNPQNSPQNNKDNDHSDDEKEEGDKDNEEDKYKVRFLLEDDQKKPYIATDYIAFLPDGSQITGQTDRQGYTQIFTSEKADQIHVEAVLHNNQSRIQ
ncbi:bacteriophage T4 gp5 trimerization domain-containing protein, partial [Rahnella sp. S5-11]|uniref:bacteriophage T4 gp5 trimerisation domain-containing protein n=1 Tax=Rahnella selenatireducens TaxID=3389797 RepID=UPI003969397A